MGAAALCASQGGENNKTRRDERMACAMNIAERIDAVECGGKPSRLADDPGMGLHQRAQLGVRDCGQGRRRRRWVRQHCRTWRLVAQPFGDAIGEYHCFKE